MVLIFLFQYFHEHNFILEACRKYLALIKAKPLNTHTHVQGHPSPIHLPTGKIQIPVIITRCFCLQQGIAYPASAWFSLRVEILNHLCVSVKQMSGAFHVLTGWCTNRPNEGCSGLERTRALLVLPPPGPLCSIELSLSSEPGTRQLENRYSISSMIYFTPLGGLGWGAHALSRSCSTCDSQRAAQGIFCSHLLCAMGRIYILWT